jgi:hypothetical protein
MLYPRSSNAIAYRIKKAQIHLEKAERIFQELGFASYKTEGDFIKLFRACSIEINKNKEMKSESDDGL